MKTQVENSGTKSGGSVRGPMVQSIACQYSEIARRRIRTWPRSQNRHPRFGRPRPPINAILEAMRNDLLYEVVDNQVRELPPMGDRRRTARSDLDEDLEPLCLDRGPGPGRIGDSLPLDRGQETDSADPIWRSCRSNAGREAGACPAQAAWEVVPNLAIEVVSPTNFANEVLEKIEDYFLSGVERVWVIYPTVGKLYDYESPTSVRILTRDQTLEGGDLAAGLSSFPWRSCSRMRRSGEEMPV